MDEILKVQRESGWVALTLHRPERKNAINLELAEQLAHALETLNADETLKVMVLRGANGVFSSGLDLSSVRPGTAQSGDFSQTWFRVHRALYSSNKIVICALERYAINGAASLAIAADWLICGTGSFLQIGEIQMGISAPRNLDWLALRHSEAVAARLCLLGDRVPAPELFRLGIATEMVADDEVVNRTAQLATTMAAHPAKGVFAVKQGMRAAFRRLNSNLEHT